MRFTRFWILLFSLWLGSSFCYSLSLYAQPAEEPEPDKILFIFKYRNLVNQYVFGYTQNNRYYLPANEILSILGYEVTVSQNGTIYSFNFTQDGQQYVLDFNNQVATLSMEEERLLDLSIQNELLNFRDQRDSNILEETQFSADDVYRTQLDTYLSLSLFDELFGLNFNVILEELIVRLEDEKTKPPILRNYERRMDRERVLESRRDIYREKYPLEYGRDWKVLDGGFLDYSFNSSISSQNESYAARFTPGIQLLGGALQGSVNASRYGIGNSDFSVTDVRWKYGVLENSYISFIEAGAINSRGLLNTPLHGVSVTNSPIEPSRIVDQIPILGRAAPNSEVELYINDALIDYTLVDGLGVYEFIVPVPYGNTSIERRVYDPSGTVQSVKEKIQTPQYFVPDKAIIYDATAGYAQSFFRGQNTDNPFMFQGVASYGLSTNHTVRAGFEHIESTDTPNLIYGELNSRLFRTYYAKINIAPQYQYDFNLNSLYPNQASWNLGFTAFEKTTLYNLQREKHEFRWQGTVPVFNKGFRLDLRTNGRYQNRSGLDNAINYRFDLTSRIDRFSVGLSFREYKYGDFDFAPNQSTRYSFTTTYSFTNELTTPYFLRGDFVRFYTEYAPSERIITVTELNISKTFNKIFRLSLNGGRNFNARYNFFGFSLDINTRFIRSSTALRSYRGNTSFNENLRGSVGYDSNFRQFLFENSDQVGRSVADFQLYVDENANNKYDEDEQVIGFNPVHIDHNAQLRKDEKYALTRYQQLPQFYRLNASVEESEIKNPLLINLVDNFSFISDPNVYKLINVPLSYSGAVSGLIEQQYDDEKFGRGGLSVILENVLDSSTTEVHSFSDGSYYFQNVIPGNYSITIDSTQLNILDVNAAPDTIGLSLQPSGEFIVLRNNNFVLNSRQAPGEFVPIIPTTCKELSEEDAARLSNMRREFVSGNPGYWIQIASYREAKTAARLLAKIQTDTGIKGEVVLNEKTGLYALLLPTENLSIAEIHSYLNSIGVGRTAEFIDVDRMINNVSYYVNVLLADSSQLNGVLELVNQYNEPGYLSVIREDLLVRIHVEQITDWNLVQRFMNALEALAPGGKVDYHSYWEADMNYTMYLNFQPGMDDQSRTSIMSSICESVPNVGVGQITIRNETGFLLDMGLSSWSALLTVLDEYDAEDVNILFIVSED